MNIKNEKKHLRFSLDAFFVYQYADIFRVLF